MKTILKAAVPIASAMIMLFALCACSGSAASSSSASSSSSATASSIQDSSSSSSSSSTEAAVNDGKTLVAYFSATGNTESVAELVADATGGTLVRIEPAVPYTSADLDYNNDSARCMVELSDPSSRPEIANTVPDWNSYDTVFVGYPIWWSLVPPIMQTFAEQYDWAGKTVIPFCTSGSSPIGDSASAMEELTNGATWLEGHRFASGATESDVKSWVDDLGL